MSEHILYKTKLRYSGLLRSEQCEFNTDVSKQFIGLNLKGLFEPKW